MFAALSPYLLDSLDKAKVIHMAGQNIVIKGTQRLPDGSWEQVWWCRIVSEGQHDAAIWNDLLRRLSQPDCVESSLPL